MKLYNLLMIFSVAVASLAGAGEQEANSILNCAISNKISESSAQEGILTCGKKAELTTGTEGSSAAIRFAPFGTTVPLNIVISAPFNQQKGPSSLLDFNGLVGATAVKLDYQRTFLRDWSNDKISHTDILDACEVYFAQLGLPEKSGCLSDMDEWASLIPTLIADGTIPSTSALNLLPSLVQRPIFTLGLSAQYGHQSFEFLNDGTINKAKSSEAPWSAGINFNLIKPEAFIATLEYQYQRTFRAQDDVTRCPTTMELVDCVTGANGTPMEQTNRNLILSVRFKTSNKESAVSIAPKLIHNLETDGTSFNLPIYFFKDSSGNLTGGFSAGWNDRDDDWTFGIFVGSAL